MVKGANQYQHRFQLNIHLLAIEKKINPKVLQALFSFECIVALRKHQSIFIRKLSSTWITFHHTREKADVGRQLIKFVSLSDQLIRNMFRSQHKSEPFSVISYYKTFFKSPHSQVRLQTITVYNCSVICYTKTVECLHNGTFSMWCCNIEYLICMASFSAWSKSSFHHKTYSSCLNNSPDRVLISFVDRQLLRNYLRRKLLLAPRYKCFLRMAVLKPDIEATVIWVNASEEFFGEVKFEREVNFFWVEQRYFPSHCLQSISSELFSALADCCAVMRRLGAFSVWYSVLPACPRKSWPCGRWPFLWQHSSRSLLRQYCKIWHHALSTSY